MSDSVRKYKITDYAGSTRAEIIYNSKLGITTGISTFDYKPYGDTLDASTNFLPVQTFAGEERDVESSYMDMGYRTYDPLIGRFLQVDPINESFPNITPYCYSYNSPMTWSDPSGLIPEHSETNGDNVDHSNTVTCQAENSSNSEERWDAARNEFLDIMSEGGSSSSSSSNDRTGVEGNNGTQAPAPQTNPDQNTNSDENKTTEEAKAKVDPVEKAVESSEKVEATVENKNTNESNVEKLDDGLSQETANDGYNKILGPETILQNCKTPELNSGVFNCISFALHNMQGDPDQPNICAPRWDNEAEDDLIQDYTKLEANAKVQEGDRIAYFSENADTGNLYVHHVGIVTDVNEKGQANRITSKFGESYLVEHHPLSTYIPEQNCGNYVTNASQFAYFKGQLVQSRMYFRKK